MFQEIPSAATRRQQPLPIRRVNDSKARRLRPVVVRLLLVLLLILGSSLAEAVVTAYCEEAYIGDCLNTRRCNYYENSHWIGSVFINYHCEGGPGGPI